MLYKGKYGFDLNAKKHKIKKHDVTYGTDRVREQMVIEIIRICNIK